MVIRIPITIGLRSKKKIVENMDVATKENSGKIANDSTLYNFGFAPKEVIERFQYFCYQYPSLSEAIKSLLSRDKLLKTKYRFMTPSVTYQMLAKPTVNDQPNSVRIAMHSLHKYMKQGRYKSVADAIEELLFGIEEPSSRTRSIGVNTASHLQEYTEISEIENEALCKIADVILLKLYQIGSTSSRMNSTVIAERDVLETGLQQQIQPVSRCISKEKKSKTLSPKDKLKFKSSSLVRQKQKLRKTKDDPDYFPKGVRKCLWSKVDTGNESCEDSIAESKIAFKQQLLGSSYVDFEILTPLCRLDANYKLPCKAQLMMKHAVTLELNTDKSLFMMNCLGLVPYTALNITSQINHCVIDLTSHS